MMESMSLDPKAAALLQELFQSLQSNGMTLLGLVVGFPEGTEQIQKVALSFNPHLSKAAQDAVMDSIWEAYHGSVQ